MILFENLLNQQLTQKDKIFLDSIYGKWVQNPKTGLIDVQGYVYLSKRNLTKIPYKFGKITGNFSCANNQLTTLEGCPIEVGGSFGCNNNNLTGLKGCPKIVNWRFHCSGNLLTNLKGCPEIIQYYFNCEGNKLQSSKYLPKTIKNYNYCIKEINIQKREYLISMGFDPKNKKLFQELMDELENSVI